jgi:hypothetical protein
MEPRIFNMKVKKTSIKMFVNKVEGQVAPSWTDIDTYMRFVPAKYSNPSYEIEFTVNLLDDPTNRNYNFKVSSKLADASVSKLQGPSEWDLFSLSIHKAGVDWTITGLKGIADGYTIKSSDGEELDWGYRTIKLIHQEALAFNLKSGRADSHRFGDKHSYLKDLDSDIADVVKTKQNTQVCIQQREKAITYDRNTRTSRKDRKVASAKAQI